MIKWLKITGTENTPPHGALRAIGPYFTLDLQVVFSVARITGVANSPQGCGLAQKASASTYLGFWTRSWTWVQGARSWYSTTELAAPPSPRYIINVFGGVLFSWLLGQNLVKSKKSRQPLPLHLYLLLR